MIAIQIGIILFLIFILAIVYQDEYRKKILARKSARLNRLWGRERRKSVRVDAEIDVLYEVASGNITSKHTSMSRNISLGGINLALKEKLPPGATLNLQLNLPANPRPIFVRGEVVWVKEMSETFTADKEERFFATGIKFTQVKSEDDAVLQGFINQRVKKLQKQEA